jgi:hypothetical protein
VSSPVPPPPRLSSDEPWALVGQLIPLQPPAVHGRTGRPGTTDRDVLEGIAFVLILSPAPPCSRSPRRPCGSCRRCWPPSGADAAPGPSVERPSGRAPGCYRQAVSVLRWFLHGARLAQLAADDDIGASTATASAVTTNVHRVAG